MHKMTVFNIRETDTAVLEMYSTKNVICKHVNVGNDFTGDYKPQRLSTTDALKHHFTKCKILETCSQVYL